MTVLKQKWTNLLLMDKIYFFIIIELLLLHTLTLDDNSATATQVKCNFDSGLCRGWRQGDGDIFDWSRGTGSTGSSNTGPDGDHTTGSGYYMFIEASFPQVEFDNANLELSVAGNGEESCLTFYYHMFGEGMGTLTVYSGNKMVFKTSGNHGNKWIKKNITINLDSTVTFEGMVGSSSRGDLAIDDVSISTGRCLVTCDFNNGICTGWRQSNSDVFDWSRGTGSTPSPNTGPDNDHTSGLGYYMFIETSSPRDAGDNAKLELSVSGNGELSCLEFFYHMYGATVGILTVYSGKEVVFRESGNHGNHWIRKNITIYLDNTVTFEGTVGFSHTGDLAIDDVSIRNGSCQQQTATSSSSTATTFTPSTSSALATLKYSSSKPSLSLSVSSTFNPSTFKPLVSSAPSMFHTSFASSSLSSWPSKFSYSAANYSLFSSLHSFTMSSTTFSLSSEPSVLHPSSVKPTLNSNASTSTSFTSKSTLLTDPSTHYLSTIKPSSSVEPSTSKHFLSSTSPTPESSLPSVSSYGSPASKSTPTPQTTPKEEIQESVILKVKDLDINKWTKKIESIFKREVAMLATQYCTVDRTRCHLISKSSRGKRSSHWHNMVFTSDMVHLLPGYPKTSPDDPLISLLALYLQFLDNVVRRDALKAILESGRSSIEQSIGVTISTVQPMFITTDATEESVKDSQPRTAIIIGAAVSGVSLLVIIIALVVGCKKSNRSKNQWTETADKGCNNTAYFIDSEEKVIEMKRANLAMTFSNLPDITFKETYL